VEARPARPPAEAEEEVLRAEHLFLENPDRPGDFLVRDVSLTVRRREVLGVFGLMGAGRTELLESLFGLHPKRARGAVFVGGERVAIRSPRDAIRAGIGLAPEDRKGAGLVLSMSLSANLTLAGLEKAEEMLVIRAGRERAVVGEYVERLGIKTPSLNAPVDTLSGGNQQKVVLGKWLATEPRVLLLDEPTRGIDIRAKQEIYALIDELTQQGLAVVFVSSELPEVLAVSDRILVMSEGRKTAEFDRSQATEETIIRAALPRTAKRSALG
jgi:ribose transport system ATP-binding protein